jgi:hypothetical protein
MLELQPASIIAKIRKAPLFSFASLMLFPHGSFGARLRIRRLAPNETSKLPTNTMPINGMDRHSSPPACPTRAYRSEVSCPSSMPNSEESTKPISAPRQPNAFGFAEGFCEALGDAGGLSGAGGKSLVPQDWQKEF